MRIRPRAQDLERRHVSRGPGRLMVAILDVLRAAAAALTFAEVATAVYGFRTVTRYAGGRSRRVAVPKGDASNIRRALKTLLSSGAVVKVETAATESVGRNGQIRYELSDRFTRNDSPRPAISAREAVIGGLQTTFRPSASAKSSGVAASPASAPKECCRRGGAAVDGREVPRNGASVVEELTDEEMAFLEYLVDVAVGLLEEQLARGEPADLDLDSALQTCAAKGRTTNERSGTCDVPDVSRIRGEANS